MKTRTTFIKIILPITIFFGLHNSCMAQKLLSELVDGETAKAISQYYKAKKEGTKISIENTSNRYINIKQSSPNLPINLTPSKYDIKLDMPQLIKIFAKYINIQQLKAITVNNQFAGILVDIRTDINGKILEVSFFTDQSSKLSLTQIEHIENNIKASSNLITVKPEMLKYLEGSNFLLIDPRLLYINILKVKQEMEATRRGPVRAN